MRLPKLVAPTRTAPLAALLALSTVVAALPAPALADDTDPDLKIEFAGLAQDQRTVRFVVTNVGKEKAPATKATVETLSPGAANEKTFDIPSLAKRGGKHELTYTLAAPCDGHRVRGIVELKKDENPGNNDVEATVCEAKPKPESKPQGQPKPDTKPSGQVGTTLDEARANGGLSRAGGLASGGPATTLDEARENGLALTDPTPEHMKPGTHTLELRPSHERTVIQRRDTGVTPVRDGTVGWFQREGSVGGEVIAVSQRAVTFDLGKLDGIERKFISKAVLSFDESPFAWKNGDGSDRFVDGCVAQLGIASVEWTGRNQQARVPSTIIEDVTPSARTEWDVTGHVRDQVRFPDDASLRHGYTLDGSLMFHQLNADDHSSCMSTISNVRLTITYTVLQ
jgi:hypothetical protein